MSTGTLTGTVKDGETGRPLAGAQVSLEGTVARAVTDAQGQYHLSVIPGSYMAQCSTLGYQEATKSAMVTTGGTATVNFSLTRLVSSPVIST